MSESSYEADIEASGSDEAVGGGMTDVTESTDEAVPDSHDADVDAGYDDSDDSPTTGSPGAAEDGTF